jgi:hypothetical protein
MQVWLTPPTSETVGLYRFKCLSPSIYSIISSLEDDTLDAYAGCWPVSLISRFEISLYKQISHIYKEYYRNEEKYWLRVG